MNKNLDAHPDQLLNFRISKFWHFFYMFITPDNLKIKKKISVVTFLLYNFKILQWLVIPPNFFWRQVESTLESRIIGPPPPIVNFWIFFYPGHPYSNPPIINFQSFLLKFFSVNSHFHHKEKEIVQSSTITMNYINTKHMLSL